MMISREDVAKTMWRVVWVVSNHALAPASPLTEEEWAPAWRDRLTPGERDVWRTAADAVIALIQPEGPVQRDERTEKLGERLDAMVAEANANRRTIRGLVAVVRELEEKLKNERDERAERPGELLGATERQLAQELANLSATAERCHVLEERARNAEALAANLRRVDNERAIELMRVKRALTSATVGDAVGRLVKAVDAYTDYPSNRWSVGMTKLLDALNDPALAVWRGK